MYSIDYESAEALNMIAVASRDNNNSHIGNATPSDIAKDMVKLLPDDYPDDWFEPKGAEVVGKYKLNLDEYANSHRVLDICCNSGVFLYRFLDRFRYALSDYVAKSFDNSEDKLCEFIIKNLLYGVCVDYSLCKKIRGILYNNQNVYGNIYHYSVLHESKCDDDAEFSIEDNKVYVRGEEMKFDVVVGNPPYNNDIYLDFVMLGHKLSKQYSLWITPAKFWAKSTCDKDTEFRDFIKKTGVCFVVYKDCKEIFDISEPGGICYYLLQRQKKVEGYSIKCMHRTCFSFNSDFETHSDLSFLPLRILDILNKFGISSFKETISLRRGYYSDNLYCGCMDSCLPIVIKQGDKIAGYTDISCLRTLDNLDKYKCIQNCICGSGAFQADSSGKFLGMPPIYKLSPNEIGKGSFHHLRFFDTDSEAGHFIEYMQTKLVNFAYICGLCGTTNSAEFYRYIPSQDSFDRIFEDKSLDGYTPDENGEYVDSDGNKHCSLYAKYKLTDEEINVIESVIRERK